jgi:hypothetical protein
MHLKDGRNIFESSKFPGYYIEEGTEEFCDVHGKHLGGNYSKGDYPGGNGLIMGVPDIVYVSATGTQYWAYKSKKATIPIGILDALEKGYIPSESYKRFVEHIWSRVKEAYVTNRDYYGKVNKK